MVINRVNDLARYFGFGIIVSILLMSTPGFGAQNYKTDSAKKITTQDAALNAQKKTAVKAPVIIFREGKLTVNMPSTTLNEALKEFSRATGIQVLWQSAEITKPVSLGFAERTVEEAIQEILKGESYMLSYSSPDREQNINRITILPDSGAAGKAVSVAQSQSRGDMFTMNGVDENIRHELEDMEQARIERWNRLEEVRNITSLEDKKEASDQLMAAMTNNPEPEARLLALENLNQLAPVQIDTLIETLSREEDPRIKLRAIDYLVERADENPKIGEFLNVFLANYEQNMN